MTEDYFPGSRQPIKPPSGGPPPDPMADRRGKVFTIGGKPVELFTISQLALYLNRKPVTLRKWEERGIIPKATYAKPGVGGDVRGRRRLYSREQVLLILQAAQEEGLLHNPHALINNTNFKTKVWSGFRELAAKK